MGKKKEEIEAEKKREIVRQLRKGPDLEQYVEGKKRKFTTYARGASLYSMNYYSFVNLAKEAGANIQIKKKVIVDLDILTMVDSRTNYARDISHLVVDTYSDQLGVFDTSIPLSVRAAEISAEGSSIYQYDPKGKAATAYRTLTEEVISHG